jgi:hypothetical protein
MLATTDVEPYSTLYVGAGRPFTPAVLKVTVIVVSVTTPATGTPGATVGATGVSVLIGAETAELIKPLAFVATATK